MITKNKWRIILSIVFTAVIFSGAFKQVFSATNYKYYLERGMSSLNDEYDSEQARNDFNRVINAPMASDRIKIRAYFWVAYSYLFDGQKDVTSGTFRQMFNMKNDISFRFESGIDELLLSNGEFMRLYDMEYKKFFKKAWDEGAAEKDDTIKMNYLTRMLVLGGIVVIALIVSFV